MELPHIAAYSKTLSEFLERGIDHEISLVPTLDYHLVVPLHRDNLQRLAARSKDKAREALITLVRRKTSGLKGVNVMFTAISRGKRLRIEFSPKR